VYYQDSFEMPNGSVVFYGRHNVDSATILVEQDFTIAKSKQRVVASFADVATRVPFGSALTDQNVSGNH